MTPQEFKAWFEGFTEAFDKVPTKAQWTRVKERVAEIDGRPVTERVYIDRYWSSVPYQQPWRYYRSYPIWSVGAQSGNITQYSQSGSLAQAAQANAQQNWNSSNAMYLLGRADAGTLEQ